MLNLFDPWPWYFSGISISFIMFLLILLGKNFGISGNLRTLCTLCNADKTCEFFCFDWKKQRWNLLVLLGSIIGGYIAVNYMSATDSLQLNSNTLQRLEQLGFKNIEGSYLPSSIFDLHDFSLKKISILSLGGMLIGFGARYAGGCTSGHAISGLSDLQIPSLIAVIGFFIGGLIMIHFLFPFIF